MSEENFQKALELTLGFEGGLADRPKADDPGGKTNLGVTEATLADYRQRYPGDTAMPARVEDLDRRSSERIYFNMYWSKVGGSQLPAPLGAVLFDAAVHSGPYKSVMWLQVALGMTADGVVGPRTLSAVQAAWGSAGGRERLVADVLARRLSFLIGLPNAKANSGWWRRIVELAMFAARELGEK